MPESKLSQIPLSVLDLAPVAEGKTPADAFKQTLRLAQHVEKLGYNRYWLAEHHNMPGIASSATAVLIGYVAANTSRIRVGSGGIMLPNHAPLVIAEQFGTLESLYPGRIDMGLGRAPGTDSQTSYALRRGAMTGGNDFPELLAELLRYLEEPDGELQVRAYPGVGLEIPIWLLGSSTFSARLSADLGLPFAFASHFAPDDLDNAIRLYRAKFQPSKQLQKPHVMVGVQVIAAETDALAAKLATTTLQKFLALVRRQPVKSRPPVESMDGLWSTYEQAAVFSRLEMAVIGGPQTTQRKLERILERTNADELIVVSDFYDFEHRLKSYEILADVWKQPLLEKSAVSA